MLQNVFDFHVNVLKFLGLSSVMDTDLFGSLQISDSPREMDKDVF